MILTCTSFGMYLCIPSSEIADVFHQVERYYHEDTPQAGSRTVAGGNTGDMNLMDATARRALCCCLQGGEVFLV